VLEELGLPREISVAPGTETTDREVPVDAHAPYVVGDSASERFDASDVFTPLAECLPSHRPHRTVLPNVARAPGAVLVAVLANVPSGLPVPRRVPLLRRRHELMGDRGCLQPAGHAELAEDV
jgi:hypothetical protein